MAVKIHSKTNQDSLEFYEEHGFVCHTILDNSFVELVGEAFDYYSKSFKPKSVAFQNLKLFFKSKLSKQFYMNKISDYEKMVGFMRAVKRKIK
tara:strand:- start:567 stop:845 length:279 start_codon:yes stop_codon:yes gene_type:complete